jgi:hypothetical protein
VAYFANYTRPICDRGGLTCPLRRSRIPALGLKASHGLVVILTLVGPVLPAGASTEFSEPDPRSSSRSAGHLPLAQTPAASSPSISLNAPVQASLGVDVNFSVMFNTDDPADVGHGPLIDIILDTTGADAGGGGSSYDGLGTSSILASYLGISFTTSGSNPTMWVITFDGAGEATHPLCVIPRVAT